MPLRKSTTNDTDHSRVTAMIMGEAGVGKTSLLRTLPVEGTVMVSCESGLLSVKDTGHEVWELTSWSEVGELFKELREARDRIRNVMIDSGTEIGELLLDELSEKFPDRKDALVKFGEFNNTYSSFIKALRDMKPFNVFVTAQEKTDKDEDNRRFKTVGVTGKAAEKLPYYFDEVWYYAKWDEDGEIRRGLITQGRQGIVAKDRSGKLDLVEQPDLTAICNKMGVEV